MSRRYLRSLAKATVGRSSGEPGQTAAAPPPPAPVVGIVEEFSRRLVRGWVVVGPQAPADPRRPVRRRPPAGVDVRHP